MKKKTIVIFMILVLVFSLSSNCYATYECSDKVKPLVSNPYIPPEKSREELYQDIFVSLL
ncbi:hypothetical protein [Clostridium sp. OS1-26]|uniref:hypothetical protein n=1 Tax=Clostridium sp. OS1-26 TaxID=3070681 RepID=UPI0027E1C839|nr:hypothetical protein [Clostridium sp. OS1-26]WML37674.1 hypothetical protein RCG18_14255 [Clostridium sp. OS1-26]